MFCPSCGKPIAEDARFCGNCGGQLTPVPTAPEAKAATPPPEASPAPTPAAGKTLSGGATVVGGGAQATGGHVVLEPGEVFHERYEIESLIGQGGMGAVYLAKDKVTGDPVCLKIILPSLVETEAIAKRFLREGTVTRNLRHPNVVSVYDVNDAGGLHYLTMEYLSGTSMRKWILENLREKRMAPLPVVCRIMREMLRGLAAAHESGIVHRDLKPENVMLLGGVAGPDFKLKILDFGIARSLRPGEQLTVSGAAMGTPVYMAPEQETGADVVGPEADLYSAAVIFYELLLNLPPRGRWELPGRVRRGLPGALDSFFEQALNSHPARRFHTAAEFVTAMDRAVGVAGRMGTLPPRPDSRAGVAPPPPRPKPKPKPKPAGLPPRLPTISLPGAGWFGRKMTWPKSMAQWLIMNAIPGFNWAAWFSLGMRSRAPKHFVYACAYLVPVVLFLYAVEAIEGWRMDEGEVAFFVFAFFACWIGGFLHALKAKSYIGALIEGARQGAGEASSTAASTPAASPASPDMSPPAPSETPSETPSEKPPETPPETPPGAPAA
ncbi:MAG: protein kinase [Planctomycetes bacterium]|nr:protein kinase [Planctomycetota bacterium]